jgi:hypothetical protein
MPAAWFMSYWQKRSKSTAGQNWVVSIGLLIATLGFGAISPLSPITLLKFFYLILTGLLNLLDERSSITAELFPLVSGIGLGMLFHAPYQVFTKTLKQRDLAAGTSAFFLVRFTGATVGLVRLSCCRFCLFLIGCKRPSPAPSSMRGLILEFLRTF